MSTSEEVQDPEARPLANAKRISTSQSWVRVL